MKKIELLYIDDEINNLNSFKASFRRDFKIYTANSSSEALQVLAKHQVSVIISDQKMPQVSGVEFFESILEIHPDPIRILLTGYSDISTVIDAINKGKVYSYITKPWDDFDLSQQIKNAYKFYTLRKENQEINSLYQNVFSESSDLILIFDEEGKVLDYNTAAATHLSWKDNRFKNRFVTEADYTALLAELLLSERVSDFESVFIDRNQKQMNVLLSANLNSFKNEELKTYQVIIKDITERKISNQKILRKIIEAQEAERTRVAEDLHDSLGQELSSVKMMIGVLKDGNLGGQQQKEVTQKCSEVLESSIKELRDICFNLMPSALEKGGFIPAFKQMVAILPIEVELELATESLHLSMEQQIALYRVSQEFVNNTLKYSEATLLKFSIERSNNGQVNIIFEDNGVGFDIKKSYLNSGRGQNTMLKRIESYGGKSILESEKGVGTKLKIKFYE